MKSVNAYLMFNGNAEEAFTFYQSVFGGELQLIRFGDMSEGANLPDEAKSLVAHTALPLAGSGQILMGSDCPPGRSVEVPQRPNFTVCLEVGDRDEAERVFGALSEGGSVDMHLAETEWTELFGMLTDKFSIPWMIDFNSSQ
ncbi:VOC family protein [Nocardia sienata]|uniref:VOC family protein n=1 Tax=Nocardia sienata TaxID=248552 RepID=UPI0007A3EE21|nr:VOC family protein [Nocardia sienata]